MEQTDNFLKVLDKAMLTLTDNIYGIEEAYPLFNYIFRELAQHEAETDGVDRSGRTDSALCLLREICEITEGALRADYEDAKTYRDQHTSTENEIKPVQG